MPRPGFFDLDERYQKLSECGEPLEVLASRIPWESFRSMLNRAFRKERKSPAERKGFDRVLMFKVLLIDAGLIDVPRARNSRDDGLLATLGYETGKSALIPIVARQWSAPSRAPNGARLP